MNKNDVDALADADSDGISNIDEVEAGLDLNDSDTDNDGIMMR